MLEGEKLLKRLRGKRRFAAILIPNLLQCCLPGLLEFRRMNIHSPRSIDLNDLLSLPELVGAPTIGHRRIFGAGHFLFF